MVYTKIGNTYWFYPVDESEIKDLLTDYDYKPTKKNIKNVVEGIEAYIQEYEYENGSIDKSVVEHGEYD